ncbi:MAG TPA: helix-turn-helix domain-containing protein [Thermoanaerobaculia bacterium]|nr:helix-turn-helix domain-containing protein [Thermoanaerobaculia bacterium]
MSRAIAMVPIVEAWQIGAFTYSRASYRAGTSLPLHAHDVASLEIITAGELTETIDRKTYELAPGSVVYKPAGMRHANAYADDVHCLLIEVPEHAALGGAVVEQTSRAWSLNLIREAAAREPGWQRIVEGLTIEALGHLERIRRLDQLRPAWLDDAIDLARKDLALAEIARRIARHPSHVAREFRRHEGVSVGEFARRCRLEGASASLRTTGASIADIALAAGFCDQSHFTNAFTRVFGVTPAAYRKWAQSSQTTGARSAGRAARRRS